MTSAVKQVAKLRADLTALDRSLSAANARHDWRAATELAERKSQSEARLRRLLAVTDAE